MFYKWKPRFFWYTDKINTYYDMKLSFGLAAFQKDIFLNSG